MFVLDGAQDLPERFVRKGQVVAFVVSPAFASLALPLTWSASAPVLMM